LLLNKDTGFVTEDLHYVRLNLAAAQERLQGQEKLDEGGAYGQLLLDLKASLEKFPEVSEIVPVLKMPLTTFSQTQVFINETELLGSYTSEYVGKGYFDLLGITLRQGELTSGSDKEDEQSFIISHDIAKTIKGQAVGSYLSTRRDSNMTVIGVVDDVFSAGNQGDTLGRFYQELNLKKWPLPYIYFLVKGKNGKFLTRTTIETAIHNVNPYALVYEVGNLSDYIDAKSLNTRFSAWAAAFLCIITLWSILIGIYSIQSYTVELRKRELSIRISVGASRQHIIIKALKQNSLPIGIGLCLGAFFSYHANQYATQWLTELPMASNSLIAAICISLAFLVVFSTIIPIIKVMNPKLLSSLKGHA
jgi:ABC-type antimicrobial peptide transport system permease subunit